MHDPVLDGQKTIADVLAELATHKGSSGGPIFDRNGKVVSVVTNGDSDTVSGASIEHLSALVRETKSFGNVRRGEWLNVHTTTFPPERGKPFEIDTQVDLRNRIGLAKRFHEHSMAAIQKERKADALDGLMKYGVETTAGAALRIAGTTSFLTTLSSPAKKDEPR